MRIHQVSLLALLALGGLAAAFGDFDAEPRSTQTSNIGAICARIATTVSNASRVSFAGSDAYAADVSRWLAFTIENSTCSVEPGTTEDVASIIKIVGATRTPFAVKGNGHAYNAGFSSTPGVQVAMAPGFTNVTYDADSGTVQVGSGLLWDEVYKALEPMNLTVVGGRSGGVGVAGLALGGGYSWLSSQHGLAIDNIVGYELVLPDGTIANIDEASQPDLMFALKGGWNNFGVVTKFTLKTYPQGPIWGGVASYNASDGDALTAAAAAFSATVTDPKAALIFGFASTNGSLSASAQLFYDGASPPPGIFDDFLAVTPVSGGFETMSYLSIIELTAAPLLPRGVGGSVALLNVTTDIIGFLRNETESHSEAFALQGSSISLSFAIETFQPTLLTHNSTPSAYPPTRAFRLQPVSLFCLYTDATLDAPIQSLMRTYAGSAKAAAIAQGQTVLASEDAAVYGNYAQDGTPVERIWGGNFGRLRDIKGVIDPHRVMDLAGGWKV